VKPIWDSSQMRVNIGVTVWFIGADIDYVIDVLNRDFENAKLEIPGYCGSPTVVGVK